MGGGGANKPLINSLNTLNTLKNSNSKELTKNLNKIQESKIKESNLDFNLQKDSKIAKDSKIIKKSKLQSLQKVSEIQDLKNLNQLKESKNLNKIQMKSSKTALGKIGISIIASVLLSQNLVAADIANNALPSGGKFDG